MEMKCQAASVSVPPTYSRACSRSPDPARMRVRFDSFASPRLYKSREYTTVRFASVRTPNITWRRNGRRPTPPGIGMSQDDPDPGMSRNSTRCATARTWSRANVPSPFQKPCRAFVSTHVALQDLDDGSDVHPDTVCFQAQMPGGARASSTGRPRRPVSILRSSRRPRRLKAIHPAPLPPKSNARP